MMDDFSRWLFGVDSSPDWVAGGDWHFELNSLPSGAAGVAALVLALLACVVVIMLYRKEGPEAGRWRYMLVGVRFSVLVVVVCMLFELVLVMTKSEQVESQLPVALDLSESMSLRDTYSDERQANAIATALQLNGEEPSTGMASVRATSRLELARQSLTQIEADLSRERVVKFYQFSDRLDPDPLSGLKGLEAHGKLTNIGDTLSGILNAHRAQPMAGILLVTDAQSNVGEDPLKAAGKAAADGIVVNVLLAGTEEMPRNANLMELETSPVIFVHDPAEITAIIESSGMEGETVGVVFESRSGDGEWETLETRELVLGTNSVIQRVPFSFSPSEPGTMEVRGRLVGGGPELSETDNIAATNIRVIRQRIRVLVLTGAPSNELQFIRNTLQRDVSVEFASWLQSASEGYEQIGTRPLRRLPTTQKELDQFDVIIMLDPDMSKLDASWSDRLSDFVGSAGGGLIYVAGELYSPGLFDPTEEQGRTRNNDWIKILPITKEPGLYRTNAEVRLSSRETWRLELTAQGELDSIFRFAADQSRNREIQASLPGMYWHFPVTRAKPGATVLVQHGDPRMQNNYGRHVLMATHLYGPGRTVFIAFDSTYRWRYLSEEHFDSFWVRLIDRVGRNKLLGGRFPFTLETDRSGYRVGDRVTVTARFKNDSESDSVTLLGGDLEVGGEIVEELTLEPSGTDTTMFQGSFVVTSAGAHTVRVLPNGDSIAESGPKSATVHFRVDPPQQEIDEPRSNRALAFGIARATGGSVFELANIHQLPAAFPVRTVERILEFRDEMWDAPILFCLLVVLLTVEWILRKRFRMA